MASPAIFCPRPELSASGNVRGFIESARRELTVFGADLPFDDHVWDVTDYLGIKSRGNKRSRINFYKFSADRAAKVPLNGTILSFAKAYCRYMHGLRPKQFIAARLYSSKALAQALEEELNTAEIERSTSHVFDKAAVNSPRKRSKRS